MFINTVSPSKIKAYNECKIKYKFRYIDKLRGIYNPNSNTDALQFGSFVHKIFEIGYNATTFEELEAIAADVRGNYKFTSKRESEVPKMLNNFLRLNEQLEEHVSSEFAFDIPITDDFSVNGIIDRVIKGKTGKYLVIDYKTSKRPSEKTELYKDPQMLMYAYAIAKMYEVPFDQVTVAHYYPHLDKLVSVTYGPTQINLFMRTLKDKIWEIRKKKSCDFRPTLNRFCNWCQFKELCPEYGGTPQKLDEAKKAEKDKR